MYQKTLDYQIIPEKYADGAFRLTMKVNGEVQDDFLVPEKNFEELVDEDWVMYLFRDLLNRDFGKIPDRLYDLRDERYRPVSDETLCNYQSQSGWPPGGEFLDIKEGMPLESFYWVRHYDHRIYPFGSGWPLSPALQIGQSNGFVDGKYDLDIVEKKLRAHPNTWAVKRERIPSYNQFDGTEAVEFMVRLDQKDYEYLKENSETRFEWELKSPGVRGMDFFDLKEAYRG